MYLKLVVAQPGTIKRNFSSIVARLSMASASDEFVGVTDVNTDDETQDPYWSMSEIEARTTRVKDELPPRAKLLLVAAKDPIGAQFLCSDASPGATDDTFDYQSWSESTSTPMSGDKRSQEIASNPGEGATAPASPSILFDRAFDQYEEAPQISVDQRMRDLDLLESDGDEMPASIAKCSSALSGEAQRDSVVAPVQVQVPSTTIVEPHVVQLDPDEDAQVPLMQDSDEDLPVFVGNAAVDGTHSKDEALAVCP